jgi:hypothetical protein
MKAHFLIAVAALGLAAVSASAANIHAFVIVRASDLSPIGGEWEVGPGTFGGTFAVDLDTLPTHEGGYTSLAAFDITTTGTDNLGLPAIADHYTSATLTWLDTIPSWNLVVWDISAWGSGGGNFYFQFANVEGTFAGGQAIWAAEHLFITPVVGPMRYDGLGSALAIDPVFVTPEPGTPIMFFAGLALLGAVGRNRRTAAAAIATCTHKLSRAGQRR